MIARPHEGAAGDELETEVPDEIAHRVELLRREVPLDRQVGRRRLEILPDRDHLDADSPEIGADVENLVECLAEAGAAAGLPRDLAERLARATVTGAGELLFQSDLPPATLRQNVTSPGGTTAAALEVLMRDSNGMKTLMREAVAAAKRRAEELAG